MAPRHQTLPPAQTTSAREALQSFYCQLCSKGYSRMNDYENHLSSYDHSHKQRLKEMRAMVRDPNAAARARKAEARADAAGGVISIKLGEGGGGGATDGALPGTTATGGFKKGGFKKSGFKSAFAPVVGDEAAAAAAAADAPAAAPTEKAGDDGLVERGPDGESDTEDEGYEVYDPRFPTD